MCAFAKQNPPFLPSRSFTCCVSLALSIAFLHTDVSSEEDPDLRRHGFLTRYFAKKIFRLMHARARSDIWVYPPPQRENHTHANTHSHIHRQTERETHTRTHTHSHTHCHTHPLTHTVAHTHAHAHWPCVRFRQALKPQPSKLIVELDKFIGATIVDYDGVE